MWITGWIRTGVLQVLDHYSNPRYLFPKMSRRAGQFGSVTISYSGSPGFDGRCLAMVTTHFRILSQAHRTNVTILPESRPRLLPSAHFAICQLQPLRSARYTVYVQSLKGTN